MIAVEDVLKSYGPRPVLARLCLEARPGQITLLVGANGSGKSTSLRLIAGLSAPDAGRVLLGGHDLARDRDAAMSGLSYLPQSPRFHRRLTVAQILKFYADLRGVEADRVTAVTREWQLEDVTTMACGRLSGGTRQRLALAVLMLPCAPMLVLDEPGLSLDPDWRRELQVALRSAADAGRTVMVATHLLGEWEGQADRCLVLEDGRIGRELEPQRLREAFPFSLVSRGFTQVARVG